MKKIVWSSMLVLVILTSSLVFYFTSQEGNFKVDIQNTRTQYYVNESGWVLAATEYVNLYDGTTKMRAISRNLTWYNDSNYVYAVRKSTWKDNITTIQKYAFKIDESNMANVPRKNEFNCINCVGKIVHYEIRDILYEGETKTIKSPFSFGHNMKIEWKESSDFSWAKVYQQTTTSDKIIIRYKPRANNATYYVRLFDPSSTMIVTLNSPPNNTLKEFNPVVFNISAVSTGLALRNLSWVNVTGGIFNVFKTINFGYDNIDDAYIDPTRWSTGSSGSGTITITETVDNQTLFLASPIYYVGETNAYSQTNNLSNISIFENITTRVYFYVSSGFSTNNVHGRLYVFGNLVGDIAVDGVGSNSDNSTWTIQKVGTNTFNVSDDGTFVSQITASSNVIKYDIYSYSGTSGTNTNSAQCTFYYLNVNEGVINSSSKNFTQEINGVTKWTGKACDYDGTCNYSSSNFTIDYDHYNPVVSIVYPLNTDYWKDITQLNYTINDSFPNYCWYSNNSGTTNYSVRTAGNNFTIADSFGANKLFVYCNDTSNQIGLDSVSYTKNRINFTGNTTNNTKGANFSSQNWIYMYVNTYDSNKSSLSFYTYTDRGYFSNITFTDSSKSYNLTNLPLDYYFFNATVCYNDSSGCFSTEERYYGNQTINFTINGGIIDLNIELGSTINLSAFTNVGNITFDIDSPEYGINQNNSFLNSSLSIVINYFRKKTLSDGLFSKIFNFSGGFQIDNKNLSIKSHQYDEVVGLEVNISSVDSPQNVAFYGCNSSTIDRAYQGFLVGKNIYLNQSINSSNLSLMKNYENITFNNPGNQTIYFYLDDNAKIKNISMYVTGDLYGFTFKDLFANYSHIDKTKTTAQLFKGGGGPIMMANSSLWRRILDDFNDGIYNLFWTNSSTVSGSGYSGGVTEAEGVMKAYANLALSVGSGSISRLIWANGTKVNLYTSDYLAFDVESSYIGQEAGYYTGYDAGCSGSNSVYFGGAGQVIFLATVVGASNETSIAKVHITERKINFTHWEVNISGTEIRTYRWADCDGVGEDATYTEVTYNYTNGSIFTNYDNPACTDTYTSLSNSTIYPVDVQYTLLSFTTAAVQVVNQYCFGANSYLKIDNVTQDIWYRNNGSVISDIIFTSASDIASTTINVTNTTYTYIGVEDWELNETIAYWLSADNGAHWESVNTSKEHNFLYPGKYIRWKVDFNTTSPGYKNVTKVLQNITINTPESNPANITFDFGNDGIWEAKLNGTFNSANGTILVDLTNANIGNAFKTKRTLYSHLYKVPLRISSTSPGLVNLFNFNITYDPNPVTLNHTFVQSYLSKYGSNFTNFTIPIGAINGSVNVSDIKLDYKGGNDTIRITARNLLNTINVTRYIHVYYSDFYKLLPYTWTEDIFFLPKTNSSKNVSAYGQTTTKPLFNITTTNYGGKELNLSIKVSESFSCLNLTWSNNSIKPSGNKINTTYKEMASNMGYLRNKSIWIWADLENCNASEQRILNPVLNIKSYCKDCLWE